MLKSKEIADFVPADTRRLRADEPIPGDLHLYFKSNSHIMLWQPAGTVFTREMIDKYIKRGIDRIWVHKSDWEVFARYLNDVGEPQPAPSVRKLREDEPLSAWEKPEKRTPPPATELIYNTKVSAKDIESIILDPAKSEREKRALAAKEARSLLGELAAPGNLEEQDVVRRAVSKVVQDLMSPPDDGEGSSRLAPACRSACQQIWKVATRDPGLHHGVNVSTTAVLFALAFGRIEEDLLADIALAGLVHDIGMTAIPYQLSQIPRESITPEQMKEYLRHVEATPLLLTALAPEIPERAILLARHHHERYSPAAASPLTELSQLIAMADALDSICSGQWDEQERTFAAGLQKLEEIENAASAENRDRSFNPDIFSAVLRWIRGNVPEDALAAATAVVGKQARSVQGG